jgi:hypothetical protein
MRPGCDPILSALDDQDWQAYLPGVEAPRGDVREVIIDHTAQAAPALHGSPGNFSQP